MNDDERLRQRRTHQKQRARTRALCVTSAQRRSHVVAAFPHEDDLVMVAAVMIAPAVVMTAIVAPAVVMAAIVAAHTGLRRGSSRDDQRKADNGRQRECKFLHLFLLGRG